MTAPTAPSRGVLLDLDETLVLTSRLEPLRKARNWPEVHRRFGETALPPDTAAFVDQLRPFARVGVVTTSPRSYAEALLAHHRLDVPVLVAYHDTVRRKPHPDPLVRALEILGVPASRAAHIGDREADDAAAHAAGVASILVSWSGGTAPPGALSSWDAVLASLRQMLPDR